MANVRSRAVLQPLQTLFHSGAAAGLTDGQLLERFQTRGGAMAEAAFEALIARHGAMVLGVCRRILSDPNDADDAFQATFLVLVQRAGTVRVDDSLGRWLHGVSYRVAVRAKARAVRRRQLESRAGAEEAVSQTEENIRFEIGDVIDEEINRLPEKYRTPVVLCHLQGLSQVETARLLGWPLGTVQGRLARARETLRVRLTRRGMAPTAGFSVAGLCSTFPSASVPFALRLRTVQALMRQVVGEAALVGTSSASAVALAEGVVATMALTKLKFASVFVLLGMIGTGLAVLPQRATAEQRISSRQPTTPLAAEPVQGPTESKNRRPVVERKATLKVVQKIDSERVAKGDQVRLRIIVENLGDGVVRDALYRVKLSAGLRARLNSSSRVRAKPGESELSGISRYEMKLRELKPHQRIVLDPLILDAVEAGEQSCEVIVTRLEHAQGGEEAKSTQGVTVVEPKLALTLHGPRTRYTDSIATYTLTVANPGTAPAHNVRVAATLPVDVRLVELPPNARFDAERRRLTWDSFRLEPGENEKAKLKFELRMGGPDLHQITAQAVAKPGLSARVTTSTDVVGLADLDLVVTEDRRVIDVGQSTTINIRIKNRGSKAATQLRIHASHSDNLVVLRTAGTQKPARYKPGEKSNQAPREFVFPAIARIQPGKEVALAFQVKALKPGPSTCHVYLSHEEGDQPLEDLVAFKVTKP